MGAVLAPGAKLPLPYHATTRSIRIPGRYELLDLHVDAAKYVERQVFFVNKVRHIRTQLLIKEKWNAIVSRTHDSQIDELLSSSSLTKLDRGFISCCGLVHSVDIPSSEDNCGFRRRLPVAGSIKVEFDDIVEGFLDVLRRKR